jgi:hypothetical protein
MNDMMYKWLAANGGTGSTIDDLWRTMLISKGATASKRNDMWFQALGNMGYSQGSLVDREFAFWNAGGVLGSSEAIVKAQAGVPVGIIPGYEGTPGVLNGTQTSSTATTINSAADVIAHPGFTGGTGSFADPYVISTKYWAFIASAVVINTADNFWIKFFNCDFQNNSVVGIDITMPAGSGVITEHCIFSGLNTSPRRIKVRSGEFYSYWSEIQYANSGDTFVEKIGANSNVYLYDTYWNYTVNNIPWGNSPFIINSGSGGSITVERATTDSRTGNEFIRFTADCAVSVNRLLFNSSISAGARIFISTNTGNALAPLLLTKTFNNSLIYTGSITGAGSFIGGQNDGMNNQSIRNLSFVHCDIRTPVGGCPGSRLISVGLAGNTSLTHTENILISWCRFYHGTVGYTVNFAPGNEIIGIFNSANVYIQYCWIDECGEDGYEFFQPVKNCNIIYSGGGENGFGGRVNGNIVDYYNSGSTTPWGAAQGNQGGHQCHDIWGLCGADAVIVESVHGVTIDRIDVTNVAGGFAPNPPYANVRLHTYGSAQPLNGTTVGTNLTSVANSFGSRPCGMTYENAGAQTACANPNQGTGVWQFWNGSAFVARDIATGGVVDAA